MAAKILFMVSLALYGSLSNAKEVPRSVNEEPQVFLPENPCSQRGGICGLSSACPLESRFPETGLCPNQQSRGAECCRMVPLNIQDCGQRGGQCVEESACGRAPREQFGICEAGQVCCVFL
ncbi:hypothetical protein SK128_011179 [Halocaridina rubra]|uniref:Uncharacterized protein n=1 Tax=Halocaridina rubra TaxID=373956 RepID=A0AAN8WZC5_HALRR